MRESIVDGFKTRVIVDHGPRFDRRSQVHAEGFIQTLDQLPSSTSAEQPHSVVSPPKRSGSRFHWQPEPLEFDAVPDGLRQPVEAGGLQYRLESLQRLSGILANKRSTASR